MQCVEKRKRPTTEIPVAGPEHFIGGKKVARPDILEAISKHQSRMLRVQAGDAVHVLDNTQDLTGQALAGSGLYSFGEVVRHGSVGSEPLPGVDDHYGEVRQVHASQLNTVKKPAPHRVPSPVKSSQPGPVEKGPPKPSSTFEAVSVNQPPQPAPLSVAKFLMTKVPVSREVTDRRLDSPAMKTVSMKRDMFELQQTPEAEQSDPVLMPMSQRKAMFEKNKSVPAPIARIGESVRGAAEI